LNAKVLAGALPVHLKFLFQPCGFGAPLNATFPSTDFQRIICLLVNPKRPTFSVGRSARYSEIQRGRKTSGNMPFLTSALVTGPAAITAFAVLTIGYFASLVIYRRFFHPLAKVPGPFLASVTALYQTYYNRRYFEQIEKLHEQYGMMWFIESA
jgi:hypothetical protein